MDEEIAQKKNHEALLEHYKKSLPVLREKLLLSLLKCQLPESEILEKCRNYGVDLKGELFSAAILDPDKKARGSGKSGSGGEIALESPTRTGSFSHLRSVELLPMKLWQTSCRCLCDP
jgi:two-component system response regulator YesN